MISPVDIRSDHLRIVQDILRAHLPGDAKVWVFGSRAAWTTADSSDLDLAIEGEKAFDPKLIGALQDAFEDSDLPYTVDVVDINRVSSNFKRIIEAQKTPLLFPNYNSGVETGQHNRSIRKSEQLVHEASDMEGDQVIDITVKQRETILALLERYLPSTAVWAYRPYDKHGAQLLSGLDLVVFASTEQSDQVSDLREAFEDSKLPFRVNLLVWNDMSEAYRKEIESEHVVLIEKGKITDDSWRTSIYGRLSSDFCEMSLSSLCCDNNGVQTGPFGSQLHKRDYVPIGTPIITVEHLGDNRIIHQSLPNVSDSDKKRLSNYKLRKGDIVFSRVGSVDRRALVRDGENGWLFSGRCLRIRPDPHKVDPGYLSYFFGWESFCKHIRSIAVGATMPSLNTKLLSEVLIPIPPIKEQRAIAHILGALDDKIELIQRMNETLESMAWAIFKDWFIDFGPTRAKARGRAPYLVPELWGLFPDAIDDENKPMGWGNGTLADVADSPKRSISPADVAKNTPYIGLKHIPRRTIALTEWEIAGKVTSNKSVFKEGEFLFGKLRPYFHKVGLAPMSGICSTDIVVVTPRDPDWAVFTLACLFSDEFINYTDQTSTGTKMPRTSWKTMGQYKIGLPPEQIVRPFQSLTQPLLERMIRNIHEARPLVQIRDLILPKFMSGEIRLREVERAVGSVA